MFRAEELEILICGTSEDLDLKKLEKIVQYEDFSPTSPTIIYFWQVVHSLSTQVL